MMITLTKFRKDSDDEIESFNISLLHIISILNLKDADHGCGVVTDGVGPDGNTLYYAVNESRETVLRLIKDLER